MSLSARKPAANGSTNSQPDQKDACYVRYQRFYLDTPALVYLKKCQEEAGKVKPSQVPYYEFLERIKHLTPEDKLAIEAYIADMPEHKAMTTAEEFELDASKHISTNFLILGHLYDTLKVDEFSSLMVENCFDLAFKLAQVEKAAIAPFNQVFAVLRGLNANASGEMLMLRDMLTQRFNHLPCGMLDYWCAMRGDAKAMMDRYYQREIHVDVDAAMEKMKIERLKLAVQHGYFPALYDLGVMALAKARNVQDAAQQLPESKSSPRVCATDQEWGAQEDEGLANLKLAAQQGHTNSLYLLATGFAEHKGLAVEAMQCFDALIAVQRCPRISYQAVSYQIAPAEDSAKYCRLAFQHGALAVLDYKQCIHLLVNLVGQKELEQQQRFGMELRDFVGGVRADFPDALDGVYKVLAENANQTLCAQPQGLAHAVLCYAEDAKFETRPIAKEQCVTAMLTTFNHLVCQTPTVFLSMHDAEQDAEQKKIAKEAAAQGVKVYQTVLTNRFLTREAQQAVRDIMLAALRVIDVRFPAPLLRLMAEYMAPFFAEPYRGLTAQPKNG